MIIIIVYIYIGQDQIMETVSFCVDVVVHIIVGVMFICMCVFCLFDVCVHLGRRHNNVGNSNHGVIMMMLMLMMMVITITVTLTITTIIVTT